MALALVGALVGLLLSRWIGDALRLTLMPVLAPDERFLDVRVAAMAVVGALVAGALAGLSPVAQWRRRDVALDLRAGVGHGASGRFHAQRLLVGVQVSLCTVLLVGAGLFSRSMRRVQAQDLGFSTARLLYVTIDFRGTLGGPDRDRAYLDAVARVRTIPGVRGATVAQGMPFASHHIPPISIPGYELPPPNVQQLPILYAATPEYLEMMGVTLREGRLFDARDGRGAPLVALVNETLARSAWPGLSAIGRCVRAGMADPSLGDPMAAAAFLPCREVVGVVRDSRARSLRTEGNEARLMQYYVPFEQVPAMPMSDAPNVHAMLVRVDRDPARLVAPVRRMIQDGSSGPVFADVRPYQDLLDPQLRSWRLGARLFSMAGALALVIAAVGLFAVVSYLVSHRTQEIGVRLALGASGRGVAGLVVRDAFRMAAAGTLAGLLVAMAGAPLVRPLLFETSPRDPATLVAAAGLMTGVAVLAALLPARRASRVSPMTSLRN
jgi:predicted permease